MNIEYSNFIGIYRNVYPPGFCQFLVNEFDKMQLDGVGLNRQQSEDASGHHKSDFQINISEDIISRFHNEHNEKLSPKRILFDGLQRCYDDYINKYSVLKNMDSFSRNIKLQKTGPGEGYHIWHSEQGPGESATRNLVWLLYLNTLDDDEAGETEFLYQQKRIKPVENTMLIWPASFTHTHRGNTVFGQNYKYIATGWFYLQG